MHRQTKSPSTYCTRNYTWAKIISLHDMAAPAACRCQLRSNGELPSMFSAVLAKCRISETSLRCNREDSQLCGEGGCLICADGPCSNRIHTSGCAPGHVGHACSYNAARHEMTIQEICGSFLPDRSSFVADDFKVAQITGQPETEGIGQRLHGMYC